MKAYYRAVDTVAMDPARYLKRRRETNVGGGGMKGGCGFVDQPLYQVLAGN